MTRVSVIIPTHGRRQALRECLESIMVDIFTSPSVQLGAGDGIQVEVIVVDDGGNPPAEVPTGVTLIRQLHQGAAAARNRGVQHSTGDIVVFLDDDSKIPKGWFVHGVTWLTNRPNLHGMAGAVTNPRNSGPAAVINQAIIDEFRRQSLMENKRVPFSTTNNLWIRQSAVKQGLWFDERFPAAGGEDRAYLLLAERLGMDIGLNFDLPVTHLHPETFRGFVRQQAQYGRGAQLVRRYCTGGNVEFSPPTVATMLARVVLHHPEHIHWLALSQLAVMWGRVCESTSPTRLPQPVTSRSSKVR
ncbi:MAG: glycosyltransferase family 2 protein [Myxococcales bacterium]|nr:glycosyltransferase family 2 protein [Myxococcales bacterium]